MIGLICALLFALVFWFSPNLIDSDGGFSLSNEMMIIFSLLLFFLSIISIILALLPLQKASNESTPLLLKLFKKDHHLQFLTLWFFAFSLFSLFIETFSFLDKNKKIAIWVILFGISFDCLRYQLRIIFNYLDPFSFLKILKKGGLRDIEHQQEVSLCGKFDALLEAAARAVKNEQPSLANSSLNTVQQIVQLFLESSKSFSYQATDTETKAFGITDKVSYTLSYVFQKMESLFQKTLNKGEETVINFMVTTLGKIVIYCAKIDMMLTTRPLTLIGKFTIQSVEKQFQDVGLRSTCTLVEVAKMICSEVDLKYLEIKDCFLCLINQLDKIAKETFKQDKKTKIVLLVQPFLDLKELFDKEKMASHQDTPVILQDLNRVIAEFQILETVMRTIPSVPVQEEPKKPS